MADPGDPGGFNGGLSGSQSDQSQSTNSGFQGGNILGGTQGDGTMASSGPGYFGTPPPSTPSQQTPQTQPGYGQQQPRQFTPGSVTQYAPQSNTGADPGTRLYPQSSPYNFTPPPQQPGNMTMTRGSGPVPTNLSYSERAKLMQQQQPQSQQQQPGYGYQQSGQPSPSYGYPNQVQGQQPQPSNVYGGNRGGVQPQMTQAPTYNSPPPQPAASQQQQQNPQSYNTGMSFAQRSQSMQQQQQHPPQQMYQSQPHQTPPQNISYQNQPGQTQSQPQPQPALNTGSFAQRSAMIAQQQASSPGMAPNGGMTPHQQQPAGSMMTPPPHQQHHQQQNAYGQQQPQGNSQFVSPMPHQAPPPQPAPGADPPAVVAQQQRILTEATRKVQEHSYYMKQAMEQHDLPTVLDRAAQMVGELGEHAHAHHNSHAHHKAPLSPKHYYELHLRALEELPTLEDYLLTVAEGANATDGGMSSMVSGPTNNVASVPNTPGPSGSVAYTMRELYDIVQYCPNVLSRLYLQICAASALIRSGQVQSPWVFKDLMEAVKCVQNPVRGLFLRQYLLQAFRDKLPGDPAPPASSVNMAISGVDGDDETTEEQDQTVTEATKPSPAIDPDFKGTVKDSYDFILANFIEMNKLWVRIQHLPGDGNSKDIRRRRERERNELRILVGTNLVRLSSLEAVTSQIYGEVILPTILDHIVVCNDPLAQAYLMDCIVQVFPDEYHIETMPILLGVCPKLRDKVNIRTILQSLMDRLANYLADEELLDEKDSNEVKKSLARDSFHMFDECVQKVFQARGPRLSSKEVIRLQTALLSFTMKCYQGNMEQITSCLGACVSALQQVSTIYDSQGNPTTEPPRPLDEPSVQELEKMLSIPLDELALGVLKLDHYADLIGFLPWESRRQVAHSLLEAVSKAGEAPSSTKELDELFGVIAPLLRGESAPSPSADATQAVTERATHLMAGLGIQADQRSSSYGGSFNEMDPAQRKDAQLVSKLIHLLRHGNTDVYYEMLTIARKHLSSQKVTQSLTALVFASLKLAKLVFEEENGVVGSHTEIPQKEGTKAIDESSDKESEEKEVNNGELSADETETVEEPSKDKEDDTGASHESPDISKPSEMTEENEAGPNQSPSTTPTEKEIRYVPTNIA